MGPDLTLPIDALIRSIEINKGKSHSLFLGAGASISSGIPSADACIWEWKRRIFLSNHPLLDQEICDLESQSMRRKIQKWFDAEGYIQRKAVPTNMASTSKSAFHCLMIVDSILNRFFAMLDLMLDTNGYPCLRKLILSNMFGRPTSMD